MRFLTTASLLGLAAFVFADEAASEAASDVLNLTAKDYDTIVNAEPLMLVEFFAPWCGHCKALAPHYEEAATALKEKGIKLAKVDCVDQADFCQEKGIQGYPTLKVTRRGEAVDYSGPRKADGIISYMIKQSLPAVSEVTSANHEEFQKSDKIVAIAYLSSTTDAPAPVFSDVAEAHRDDYLFGITIDQKAIDAAGVKPPAIVVYRSFDEPKSEYPYPITSVTKKDVVDWIKDLAVPIIDEVNGENYGLYANSGKPLAYLFVDPSLDTKDAIIEKVKPVAAKYKSKVNFVWIDAVKFGDHAKALNIAEVKWPAFVIQNLEKQLKYPLDQSKDLTSELVEDWVSQYVSDKLQPELKSQPIPPTQNDPVFNLVGKHFEEVVFDDSKDVFVEFYAPWCGHCKRLAPAWESLGLKYKPIEDKILIAKMDATENDLPPSVPFRVSGFPTLKFKPAGGREWVDYEGDRSIESLLEFIEKNAKNSLELPVVAEDAKQVPYEAETPPATHTATSEPSVETHDEL
ncbi:disulfide isomerase [Crepidotus variabilis]|uniref:Protein disulfide-isomerase n=1 Tax=Crepidotus variabilis TaxID=179855 RepID=A0A9P6EQM3_9AGAR|nr:disulfide isomerase [Crepidotus variabilis]